MTDKLAERVMLLEVRLAATTVALRWLREILEQAEVIGPGEWRAALVQIASAARGKGRLKPEIDPIRNAVYVDFLQFLALDLEEVGASHLTVVDGINSSERRH